MTTLLEMLNASEVREDDESFKNAVDLMFEQLEKRDPEHFAVRQYKKYKMAAGDICSKRYALRDLFIRFFGKEVDALRTFFIEGGYAYAENQNHPTVRKIKS